MRAIVTGASSGIGQETARILQVSGWEVFGLSRRGTAPEGVRGVSVDVTDPAAVKRVIDEIASDGVSIDLLINNAGFGIAGPIETTSPDDAARQMNVNFLGQFYVARAVLPYMRAAKKGRILCISSVAGQIAIPYQAFYSASKAAVLSFALALRNETADFGICVSAILPGDVQTGFTDARSKADYGAYTRAEASIASMEKDERSGLKPTDVSAVIMKAASAVHPSPIYVVGGKYKLFSVLFKLLPARFAYWIVKKMY